VYVGVPEEFTDSQKEKVETALRSTSGRYITIGDIAEFLGSRVR
jgi:large subunit ribosomal protein L13